MDAGAKGVIFEDKKDIVVGDKKALIQDGPRRDDFVSLKYLGEGSVGSVAKVMHKSSGNVYALKTVDKQRVLEHGLDNQLLSEVRTQMTVSHENLLRCFDYFEEAGNVYLVLEFAGGGDLYRHLRSRPGCRLDGPDTAHIFKQILGGVGYLHGQGIIHRDLKPENILLASATELTVKVADFGWAAKVGNRTTFCGTLCMLSPEMVTGQTYDTRVDIWAVGVLLFEMLTGTSPFDRGGGLMETCQNIVKGLEVSALLKAPESAQPLIGGLLQVQAESRMPLETALQHPWLVAQVAARMAARGETAGSVGAASGSGADRPSGSGADKSSVAGSDNAPTPSSAVGTPTGWPTEQGSTGISTAGPDSPADSIVGPLVGGAWAAPGGPAGEPAEGPSSRRSSWDLPSTGELLVAKLPGKSGQAIPASGLTLPSSSPALVEKFPGKPGQANWSGQDAPASTGELLVAMLPGKSGQAASAPAPAASASAPAAAAWRATPLQEVEGDSPEKREGGASQSAPPPQRRAKAGEMLKSLDLDDEEDDPTAGGSSPSSGAPKPQVRVQAAPPRTRLEIANLGAAAAAPPGQKANHLFIPPTRGEVLMSLEPEDNREMAKLGRPPAADGGQRLPKTGAPKAPTAGGDRPMEPTDGDRVPAVVRSEPPGAGPAVPRPKAPSPCRTPQGSILPGQQRESMAYGGPPPPRDSSRSSVGSGRGSEYLHGFRMTASSASVGPGEARFVEAVQPTRRADGAAREPHRSEEQRPPRASQQGAAAGAQGTPQGTPQGMDSAADWLSASMRWVGLDPCAVNGSMGQPTDMNPLVEQLLEMGYSKAKAAEACKRSSTLEGALSWLAEHED